MIQSKRIDVLVACAVVFAVVVSMALVVIGRQQAANGQLRKEPEYAEKVFGADIISVEIIADEDDWQAMLDNALSEQFIMVDVVVNGRRFNNVGIRPKGNSSLMQVASSGSDRYSFRLQLDKYIDGQTCFGLQSFVLNNMLGDFSYMKEYVSYDLMREVGVAAPYFGYAQIKVNGEDWGLYLAVELYNDSYEQRVFGDTAGMLYNVKTMDMDMGGDFGAGAPGGPGAGMMRQGFPQMPAAPQAGGSRPNPAAPQDASSPPRFSAPVDGSAPQDAPSPPNLEALPRGQWFQGFPQGQEFTFPGFPGQGGADFFAGARGFGGRGGGSLEYIDGEVSSYPSIFNNVVGRGTESDFKRVIKALKALSEGRDLETYFDVDQILRYLAAHTFVVNLDSYSSGMAQNYYIYERHGRLTILPWDYNLAWGGFQGGGASSVINFPIDTPVSGVDMASRPLIAQLFAVPEYLERYHGYLQHLVESYFADGKFEAKIRELDALIGDYVKNDPAALCTFEQYQRAVEAFITLGSLRAESVQGQLDGTIPSTTEGQRAEPAKLISPGSLNLSVLGSQMGSMGGGRVGRQDAWIQGPEIQVQRQTQQSRRVFGPGGISPTGSSLWLDNLRLYGGLFLVLLAAIVFAARYRRTY